MNRLLLLALGGALGTVARYGLNGLISARLSTFPLGTMIVNITGCFVIGLITPLMLRYEWRLFLLFGLCGGYTTFSSFEWETYSAVRQGGFWLGLANVLGSVVFGYAAVWLGALLARR